jgi:hypothetical protein
MAPHDLLCRLHTRLLNFWIVLRKKVAAKSPTLRPCCETTVDGRHLTPQDMLLWCLDILCAPHWFSSTTFRKWISSVFLALPPTVPFPGPGTKRPVARTGVWLTKGPPGPSQATHAEKRKGRLVWLGGGSEHCLPQVLAGGGAGGATFPGEMVGHRAPNYTKLPKGRQPARQGASCRLPPPPEVKGIDAHGP